MGTICQEMTPTKRKDDTWLSQLDTSPNLHFMHDLMRHLERGRGTNMKQWQKKSHNFSGKAVVIQEACPYLWRKWYHPTLFMHSRQEKKIRDFNFSFIALIRALKLLLLFFSFFTFVFKVGVCGYNMVPMVLCINVVLNEII